MKSDRMPILPLGVLLWVCPSQTYDIITIWHNLESKQWIIKDLLCTKHSSPYLPQSVTASALRWGRDGKDWSQDRAEGWTGGVG